MCQQLQLVFANVPFLLMVHLHRLEIILQRLLHMLHDSPELLDEGLIVCVEVGLVQGQEQQHEQVARDCPVRRVGRDHI